MTLEGLSRILSILTIDYASESGTGFSAIS